MTGPENPSVLIISNKFDFSTDLIAHKLKTDGHHFLRLNRDQLGDYRIDFKPTEPSLTVEIAGQTFVFREESLKSIYFRAPTFLREVFSDKLSEEEQLYNSQWAAFIRALTVFEDVHWVNNPADTYKAEIKALQLKTAKGLGFRVPDTLVTNHTRPLPGKVLAIKSIDSAIVTVGEKEAFVYTNIIKGEDLDDQLYSSPFFVQQALTPKTDIRVTVIGDRVIPIRILGEGGIDEDWRKYEQKIRYELFELPDDIGEACLRFARKFNLQFAAIDLIWYQEAYYFIEVNPTGEWAWLQKNTDIPFDEYIVATLTQC